LISINLAYGLLLNFVGYFFYGIADSRGRLVAGSFQGYTDHVDGKPSDARFNHPKGITMDDKGNVYVADTQNLAIRKIGDAGMC
jgi:putative methionine-R-sulfoxide reductase with GAF domain